MWAWVLRGEGFLQVGPKQTHPSRVCRATGSFGCLPVTSRNTLWKTGWSLPIKMSICLRLDTLSKGIEVKCGQSFFKALHSIAGVFPVMLSRTLASTGAEKDPFMEDTEQWTRLDCFLISVPPVPEIVKFCLSPFN